ncbi:hypothetical protein Slin15195_G069210 [Septoria linicola]|uniref:Uncharacterized protein n=1 Tax=Septoria linicola TaxID=215465 RepID=A0A9Q9AQ08_9PEZI|nr:hypothetical protein Slin15195_G069210 [Septoria linicola]
MQKARDYCEVLGCTNVRPVELQEGDVRSTMSAGFGFGSQLSSFGGGASGGAGLFGSAAPMVSSRARRAVANDGGEDERTEDLSFDAQEVKMAMDVTIKFHADHAT